MQTLQANSKSYSDSPELDIASGVEPLNILYLIMAFLRAYMQLSESLDNPVDNYEKSDGSSNITVVWSQHGNGSQVFLVSYLSVGP